MWLLQVTPPNPLDFLEPGAVALLIAVLLFNVVVVGVAFGKEWVVPGAAHKRSVEREERVTKALESLSESVGTLVKITKGGE